MTDNLSPCPFCDSAPDLCIGPERKTRPRIYYVKCNVCLAETTAFTAREIAVSAWNRRPAEAQVEALRKALEKIAGIKASNGARFVAEAALAALASSTPESGISDADGIAWFERTFGVPLGDKPGALDVERVRAGLTPESSAEAPASQIGALIKERDEWKERAGFLWTAPDVDMWGKVAESKGVHIREKVNGLLRRAVRAEGQNEALAQVLLDVRAAIVEHAPDTLWVSLIETAVDCIDSALAGAAAPAEARSAQAGSADDVE